jgi:hypothetical protein
VQLGTAYQNGQTTTNDPGAFGVMKLTRDQYGYSRDYQSAPAAKDEHGNPAWVPAPTPAPGICHGPSEAG